MNMTIPDASEGVPHSLQRDSDGPAGKAPDARVQKLSLFVGFSFVAFYLLSSLWIASHRRFWHDELSTVFIARLHGVATIWKALANLDDLMPATYFLLVRFFDQPLGPGELAARIPSVLGLAVGFLITFDCARRLTDNLHALASIALLGCSVLPYYGYEARPYALYFMFGAMELWLWLHAPGNRKSSAILFGLTFFLAFGVHYYSALCLVPYCAFEASRWKPWRAPSPKLLAGCLGVLCGAALFSHEILAAHANSAGFWASPTRGGLFDIFTDLFPYGLFIVAAGLIWIAFTARPEKLLLDPMLPGERLGWYFLLIPLAGFVAAELVTNAFYNRYFIGMLPGMALALACALWRHFQHRPGTSAGIVLVMFFFGLGHQVTVTAKPSAIQTPSVGEGPAELSDALAWEAILVKDGKKNIAVPVYGLVGLEACYYSKHPELYTFVLPPGMGEVRGPIRSFAQSQPVRFWSFEDLRAAARDTALIDPSDQMLKAMIDAGLHVKQVPSKEISSTDVSAGRVKLVYLE